MNLVKALANLWVCNDSSRVGEMTSARAPIWVECFTRRSTMGIKKEAVLPEPVCAYMRQCRSYQHVLLCQPHVHSQRRCLTCASHGHYVMTRERNWQRCTLNGGGDFVALAHNCIEHWTANAKALKATALLLLLGQCLGIACCLSPATPLCSQQHLACACCSDCVKATWNNGWGKR